MKIRALIPNTITALNLASGTAGIVCALAGRFDTAFCLMLAAAVFDFLDGFAARLLHIYSDLGRELDSLADLVSFGVLPAMMLISLMDACNFGPQWVNWTPVLIAVFSGLRLARFNTDDRQKDTFLGLATPAAALLCASLCVFVCHTPASFPAIWAMGPVFIPALSICICALLVCQIPMFSLKFHKGDPRILTIKRILLIVAAAAAAVLCLVCGLHISLAVLLTILCYIIKNIIYAIAGI